MIKMISLGEYKFELKLRRRIKDVKGKQLRKVVLKEVHNKKIEKLKKNDSFKGGVSFAL